MIDFDEREVPAEVRVRITDAVHAGLAKPARPGLRTPLVVAASVAGLLAVGLVTAIAAHDQPDQGAARPTAPVASTPTTVKPSTPAEELDRCWQGIVAKGKQADFPARSTWTTVQREPSPSANVTAVRGGGKTFFCMTTRATVTVTDPKAAVTPVLGTSIRVALADDNGWVLGTVVSEEYVTIGGAADGSGVGVETPNKVFLIHADAMADLNSRMYVQLEDKQVPIPPAPAPAVELVDRPLPAPDRTSANGKRLGECLDKAGWPASYADQWRPLAYTKLSASSYAVTAGSAGQLGVCVHYRGSYHFQPLDPVPASAKPQAIGQGSSAPFSDSGGTYLYVMGTVPAAAKTATFTVGKGKHYEAGVGGGTWVVAIPMGGGFDSILVKDAGGKVLYSGAPEEVDPKHK